MTEFLSLDQSVLNSIGKACSYFLCIGNRNTSNRITVAKANIVVRYKIRASTVRLR